MKHGFVYKWIWRVFCAHFYSQWTQMHLRRPQDVLKMSRRLATKPDVVTTSGKRCFIYDVLKTSDLRRLEEA